MSEKKLSEEQTGWLIARLAELGLEGDEASTALGAIAQMVSKGEIAVNMGTTRNSGDAQWLCLSCYDTLCSAYWGEIPTLGEMSNSADGVCSQCEAKGGTFYLVPQ